MQRRQIWDEGNGETCKGLQVSPQFSEEVNMTILEDNPVPLLVSRYRKLKAQRDAIDAQMSKVKAELEPIVEAEGKWQDKEGYARITERKPSVSYNGSAVDNLAEAWCKSENAVMQSCGEMLRQHRKESPGSTYLQIK